MILYHEDSAEKVVDQIGGKARGLLLLKKQGYRTPVWAVIPNSIIQERTPSGEWHLSSEDRAEIQHWLNQHIGKNESVIVRSSAFGEDGAAASFAGMFESFPHLKTFDQVVDAIQKCVRSSESARVGQYRSQMNIEASQTQMAVIIQKQIQFDKAGVLLTSNLALGVPSQVLISALWGQGQGVVDGHLNSDEYRIDLYPWRITKQIANKTQAVYLNSEAGLEVQPVPPQRQDLSTLSEGELRTLVKIGLDLEKMCGRAQDIEWGIVKEQVYLLQTRDIVASSIVTREEEIIVLDNSNIQESFQGLTLPLTFSYATEVYQSVYVRLMGIMGFSRSTIEAHIRRQGQMLALAKGRVYYNINSWYEGLLLMPGFQKNKSDMEKMMGVSRPIPFVEDQAVSAFEKVSRVPGVIKLMMHLSWHFAFLAKSTKNFLSTVRVISETFQDEDFEKMPPRYLHNHFQKVKAQVLNLWTAPIVNDFYVMIYSGKVRRILEKVDRADLFASVIAGGDVESLKPLRAIRQMAETIEASPGLMQRFWQEGQSIEKLALQDESLKLQLQEFLRLYGDRVPGELKLETITFHDDIQLLTKILTSLMRSQNLREENSQESAPHGKAIAEAEACIQGKMGFWAKWAFRSHLKKARRGILWREAMRLERTRSFGLARRVYKTLGKRFFEQGLLTDARDIFYLTTQEVDHLLNGKSVTEDFKAVVIQRKQQYAIWQNEKVPSQVYLRIPTQGIEWQASELSIQAEGLSGIGCFPGHVEAEVVVVQDPFECPDLRGKILVTERTDPGWTPLFSQIKGLLVEKGSALSHSAVVAREMGLPTVVNIPGLLARLQTGQRVQFNGSTGMIKIMDSPSEVSQRSVTKEEPVSLWN